MKKFLVKIVLPLAAALLTLVYLIETTDVAGLASFQPRLTAVLFAHEKILVWNRPPYPAYYTVEVFNRPPRDEYGQRTAPRLVKKYRTFANTLTVGRHLPLRTCWRVTANGLFAHPLGRPSRPIGLTEILGQSPAGFAAVKPVLKPISSAGRPASDRPALRWRPAPGAVDYEIEFLSRQPENPNDIKPSRYRAANSRQIFTNGYRANLRFYNAGQPLYWRVRALDYDGRPIGVFSDAAPLYIDHRLPYTPRPEINCIANFHRLATPLYPVYAWIPISAARRYEVELLRQEPENPNGVAPSAHRIWSKIVTGAFDCYDDEPRLLPGVYYWRVRGLDENGATVGRFSATASYVVDLKKGRYAATFGDSITHGGGAISYSPANWEYSFQTYLSFENVNLGHSGDTAAAMAARFDADVLPFRPRNLLILGGANSLRGGVPADSVIRDLTLIRDKCLSHDIRPIFLTLIPINPARIDRVFGEKTAPDWREQFAAVNAFIRRQTYYIDLAPYFTNARGELSAYYATDGLHPDIEGKKLMAQIINAHKDRVMR